MERSERHTKDRFNLIKFDEKSCVNYVTAALLSLRFLELIFSPPPPLKSIGHRIVPMNQRARTRTLARPKQGPFFQRRTSSPARLADDGDRVRAICSLFAGGLVFNQRFSAKIRAI